MCDSWDLCEDLDLRDVALLVLLSFTAHSSSSRLDLNTRQELPAPSINVGMDFPHSLHMKGNYSFHIVFSSFASIFLPNHGFSLIGSGSVSIIPSNWFVDGIRSKLCACIE
ncbi:hypothetical protein HUJ04_011978 [Dendroctonus ponderosae]|nr:hypothetical protein HUJ04_011978 [Dendroctonus ponderosae]